MFEGLKLFIGTLFNPSSVYREIHAEIVRLNTTTKHSLANLTIDIGDLKDRVDALEEKVSKLKVPARRKTARGIQDKKDS